MCGLTAYAEATIGSLGVELRKRTTIGVELAAKVSVIIMPHAPLMIWLAKITTFLG
jgi:ATP-binding cassette, subfamily G (WHITE), member 2, SNQ2